MSPSTYVAELLQKFEEKKMRQNFYLILIGQNSYPIFCVVTILSKVITITKLFGAVRLDFSEGVL